MYTPLPANPHHAKPILASEIKSGDSVMCSPPFISIAKGQGKSKWAADSIPKEVGKQRATFIGFLIGEETNSTRGRAEGRR
eukprot:2354652-Pleurochrysis_carterae.AAC.1